MDSDSDFYGDHSIHFPFSPLFVPPLTISQETRRTSMSWSPEWQNSTPQTTGAIAHS